MFRVRFLKLEDFNDIVPLIVENHELHKETRSDVFLDFDLDFIIKYLNDCLKDDLSKIFVVEDISNKKVIAFAITKLNTTLNIPILKPSSYIFIDNLCVNKNYRNIGVGTLLFTSIKNFCLLKELDSIQLNVWDFNKIAINFYESLGFLTRNRRLEMKIANLI